MGQLRHKFGMPDVAEPWHRPGHATITSPSPRRRLGSGCRRYHCWRHCARGEPPKSQLATTDGVQSLSLHFNGPRRKFDTTFQIWGWTRHEHGRKPLVDREIIEHMGKLLDGSPSKRVRNIDRELHPPSDTTVSGSDSDSS